MRLHFRQFFLGSCLAIGMTAGAQAQPIDQIVAFGDSLSDSGNLYRYTNVIHANHPTFSPIPGAPYWRGHFSDGPIWVEELLKRLKKDRRSTTLDDYAVGGASVQLDRISPLEILWPRHTSHDEIFAYLNTQAEKTSTNNQHLYALWMGANDYINLVNQPTPVAFDAEAETTNVVNMIENDIKALIQDVNAKKFIVLNLPDLGKTPGGIILGDDASTNLSQLTKLHNLKLQQAMDRLTTEYPNVTFVNVDIFYAMNELIDNHTWRGEKVEDVSFPCYAGEMSSKQAKARMQSFRKFKYSVMLNANRLGDDGDVCDNPNDHLFWDWIHPSTRIHRMIADQAMVQLSEKGLR